MNWIQNIIVGTLFFTSLTILGYFTIVSDNGPFASTGIHMLVFFDNAEGIKVGSRVTVLGVPMGKVADINLVAVDKNNRPVAEDSPQRVGQRVAVTLELKRPIVFYENYEIALKNETLLSGKVITIDPGSAGVHSDGSPIETIPVQFLDPDELVRGDSNAFQQRLLDPDGGLTFVDIQGESPGDPLAGLSEIIDENRDDVKKTIENVAEITEKINNGHGTLGLLVNDDKLHRNANTLISDAQITVREMRESLEDTREQAPVNSFIRAALTAF